MANYLVVGPSWVGDMVMAQSLFMTLCERDHGANIDVVAPQWSIPVLARMPEVRRAISLSVSHRELGFVKRRVLGRSLRGEGYDRAIVLPCSWKSALVPYFAGVKKRVGFLGEQRYGLLTDKRKLNKDILNQTVKRFVSLGLPSHEAYPPKKILRPRLTVDQNNQQSLYRKFGLPIDRPAAVLMPGAEYGSAKQWPLSYYRQIAEYLCKHGLQVWIVGGPGDIEDGETIVSGLHGAVFNLCGKTQLDDAVDLIAAARFVVCNDSGLMHIAAAVGTEVHAIYGSSSDLFTPPLADAATSHSLNLSCSPCFKRHCPFGHYNCLRQLLPEQIIAALPTTSDSNR